MGTISTAFICARPADYFALDHDGNGDAVSTQFIARSEQTMADSMWRWTGGAADNLELILSRLDVVALLAGRQIA